MVREVSLLSTYACKRLLDGQLTSALVPTVPSPCFFRQSTTIAKVRDTFGVSFVPIRFVIGELLSEVGGQVGHGLVLAWFESCWSFLYNRQDKRNTLESYLPLSVT